MFLSLAITNASVGKSFDPLKKSLGTVSRSNYNRCITSQGTYTLSITGRGKVASVVCKIAYIPNKYINGEIKNLKKSKVNDGVILLTGKVPKVGEAFAVALMLENKEIDAMISKLKKVKKVVNLSKSLFIKFPAHHILTQFQLGMAKQLCGRVISM